MSPKSPLLLTALAAAAAGLGACGSSDGSSTTSTPAASTPAAATTTSAAPAAVTPTDGAITVDSTEYAFAPKAISTTAGKLKLTLDNKGKIEHEIVILKTDAAPDALKQSGGRVSEADSVGEISETAAGKAVTKTFDLKPGHYVFVCNIPTHYQLGMRGALTVK